MKYVAYGMGENQCSSRTFDALRLDMGNDSLARTEALVAGTLHLPLTPRLHDAGVGDSYPSQHGGLLGFLP